MEIVTGSISFSSCINKTSMTPPLTNKGRERTMKNIFSSGSKLHWMKNLYLRFKYGAGCCDVYGLDYFLAKRTIRPLKEFRRHDTVSYPPDLTVEKWEAIIDEMIWAFEHFINEQEDCTDYSSEQMKQNYERQQKGFELFGKYFTHLWF